MINVKLLLGKYFAIGETCCITANPGVGKTYLALDVAKHPAIKKNVYFELDDGYNQKERLEHISTIHPIYEPEFEQSLENLRKDASYKCLTRAINNTILKASAKIEKDQLRIMRQLGIYNSKKIDELFLFEIYVKEAIENGADLITLDTLSSLVDFPWEITRTYVKRIIKMCRKNNVSLLILQHTTKQGIYSGTSGLAQVVDTLLYLDDIGGNLRKITVEKARFEKNKEDCVIEMISEGDNAVRFEVCENPKANILVNFSPLEKEILDAIEDKDSMMFKHLMEVLKTSSNETSIKNHLKSLEKKGFISKGDGKSWDEIKNIRN